MEARGLGVAVGRDVNDVYIANEEISLWGGEV